MGGVSSFTFVVQVIVSGIPFMIDHRVRDCLIHYCYSFVDYNLEVIISVLSMVPAS